MPKKKSKDKESDEESDDEVTNVPSNKKSPKKQGLNFYAIAIMLMFALPFGFALVLQVIDFMYPEAAMESMVRRKVANCYEAANPSKLGDIDKFIKKYKGREQTLFAQLRTKYEKFPECQ